MSKKPLEIWFDQKGDMLDQAYGWGPNNHQGYKSEIAQDFTDKMEFIRIQDFHKKGARVYIRSISSGRQYSMYVEDFGATISAHKLIDNFMEGTWHFIKRGSGQAIELVIDETL